MSPSLSSLCLPCLSLVYLRPQSRQAPDWSYRQALTNSLLKVGLRVYAAAQIKHTLSLKPHLEGDRFTVIYPASPELYTGVALDQKVKPETIGGTWFPKPFSSNSALPEDRHVVFHMHGGSYILGTGRTGSCQHLAKNLLSHTPSDYVFSLQYRLACHPNARFPAQLQDAISAYIFLIQTLCIPPSRIILSGDSCGAHLALALLRYIAQYDTPSLLPAPKCTWLFSPWGDIPTSATNPESWHNNPNYKTEYIPETFPEWGAKQFLGDLQITELVEQYVAPLWHPFVVPSPVLIETGGREVLLQNHEQLASTFQHLPQNEERVELFVEESVPHDVLMVGWIMGFREEARRCAITAGEFATRS